MFDGVNTIITLFTTQLLLKQAWYQVLRKDPVSVAVLVAWVHRDRRFVLFMHNVYMAVVFGCSGPWVCFSVPRGIGSSDKSEIR